jgi:ferredoxin
MSTYLLTRAFYCFKGRGPPTQIVEQIGKAMLESKQVSRKTKSKKENAAVYDIVEKHWPMSVGDGKATRKKRPRILAITTDCCTGCAGSPACIEYCPIEACMFWIPDEDHPPFGRIEVDPYLCIGCQKCTSKGPDGAFLDGCPWDAIEMVPTDDWESLHGIVLPDAPPAPPAS